MKLIDDTLDPVYQTKDGKWYFLGLDKEEYGPFFSRQEAEEGWFTYMEMT